MDVDRNQSDYIYEYIYHFEDYVFLRKQKKNVTENPEFPLGVHPRASWWSIWHIKEMATPSDRGIQPLARYIAGEWSLGWLSASPSPTACHRAPAGPCMWQPSPSAAYSLLGTHILVHRLGSWNMRL